MLTIKVLGLLCLLGSILEMFFESSLEELSASWILSLQSIRSDFLDQVLLIIEPVSQWCFVAYCLLVYLCSHKRTGGLGVLIYIFCSYTGNVLKMCYAHPRPLYAFSSIEVIKCSKDFGYPSGHAIITGGVIFFLTYTYIKSGGQAAIKVLIASLILIIVAIDRLYLAKHFHFQVLMGYIYSAFIVSICIQPSVSREIKKVFADKSQLIKCHIVGIMLIVISSLLYVFRDGTLEQAWVDNYQNKCAGELIFERAMFKHFKETWTVFAALGFCTGYFYSARIPIIDSYQCKLLATFLAVVFLAAFWFAEKLIKNLFNEAALFIVDLALYYAVAVGISYLVPKILYRIFKDSALHLPLNSDQIEIGKH